MGLLSSLFGKKAAEELESLVKNVTQGIAGQNPQQSAPQSAAPAPAPVPQSSPIEEEDGPSGFSWGPKMPAEENQYNFPGTFEEYFTKIFQENFGGYSIEIEGAGSNRQLCYTFRSGGSTALVVEILPKNTSVEALRRKCRNQGIPYLRFYHNYDGWWNTKAYVIQRVSNALGK